MLRGFARPFYLTGQQKDRRWSVYVRAIHAHREDQRTDVGAFVVLMKRHYPPSPRIRGEGRTLLQLHSNRVPTRSIASATPLARTRGGKGSVRLTAQRERRHSARMKSMKRTADGIRADQTIGGARFFVQSSPPRLGEGAGRGEGTAI